MTKAPGRSLSALHVTKKLTKTTAPPVSAGRRKPSEVETLPPPRPEAARGQSQRVKKGPEAVKIDEVTADLSKDPRHED